MGKAAPSRYKGRRRQRPEASGRDRSTQNIAIIAGALIAARRVCRMAQIS
jgi:hypothetical protein